MSNEFMGLHPTPTEEVQPLKLYVLSGFLKQKFFEDWENKEGIKLLKEQTQYKDWQPTVHKNVY